MKKIIVLGMFFAGFLGVNDALAMRSEPSPAEYERRYLSELKSSMLRNRDYTYSFLMKSLPIGKWMIEFFERMTKVDLEDAEARIMYSFHKKLQDDLGAAGAEMQIVKGLKSHPELYAKHLRNCLFKRDQQACVKKDEILREVILGLGIRRLSSLGVDNLAAGSVLGGATCHFREEFEQYAREEGTAPKESML